MFRTPKILAIGFRIKKFILRDGSQTNRGQEEEETFSEQGKVRDANGDKGWMRFNQSMCMCSEGIKCGSVDLSIHLNLQTHQSIWNLNLELEFGILS